MTTDYLLKDDVELQIKSVREDIELSILRNEVDENEYRLVLKEHEKKKSFVYWSKVIMLFIMAVAILILYFVVFQ